MEPARSHVDAADLVPPGAFSVEVVDEQGSPLASIPVLLLTHPRTAPNDPYQRRMPGSEVTGSDGRVFFSTSRVCELRARALERGQDLLVEATIGPGFRDAPRAELPTDLREGSIIRLVVSPAVAGAFKKLRVRVVDAGGTPVGGVGVQWLAWREDRPGVRQHFGGASGETRATDGIAELSLEVERELRWQGEHSGGTYLYRVHALLPLGNPFELDLGPRLPIDELVTLRLPESGALRVRVEQADGSPLPAGVTVLVSAPQVATSDKAWKHVENGQALFPAVGLGLELALVAQMDDDSHPPVEAVIRCPFRPGETVEARLSFGPAYPMVAFVAVDERGEPLAAATLRGEISTSSGARLLSWDSVYLQTGGEGRARFPVSLELEAAAGLSLELEAEIRSEQGLLTTLTTHVDLPIARQPAHELDLGSVVFRGPAPSSEKLLVSGVVLDELGAPLERAVLVLEPMEDGEPGWQVGGYSAPDGSFEIRGPAGSSRLRLTAATDEHLGEMRTDLVPGTTDLVFRLSRGARWEARFLSEEWLPLDLLVARLAGPEERSVSLSRNLIEPNLVPGEYDLDIRTVQGSWLVARVEKLSLRPGSNPGSTRGGEHALDPRLDPLDLRGRLALCRFRLESPEGSIFNAPVLVHVEPWGDGPARTDEEGRLALLVPAGATALEIEPRGFERRRCAPSRAEAVLVFSPR